MLAAAPGTNYVYLNLSRSSWFGVGTGLGLTFGFLCFLLVEEAVSRRKRLLALLAGALGGVTLYSYLGTVFLPVASLAYFAFVALQRRASLRETLPQAAFFAGAALLVCLPNLLTITQNTDAYTLRSKAVYVEQTDDAFYRSMDATTLAWSQITNTARGFLLLDPVTGAGPENARYSPAGESPVDTLTRSLFLLAIPTTLFIRRKELAQPAFAFFFVLVITQVLTVYPPNFARGVFALPFIYLLVVVLLDAVWATRLPRRLAQFGIVIVVVATSAWNLQYYYQWGAAPIWRKPGSPPSNTARRRFGSRPRSCTWRQAPWTCSSRQTSGSSWSMGQGRLSDEAHRYYVQQRLAYIT